MYLSVADAANKEQVTACIDVLFFYRFVHCNSMQTLASGEDAKNHVGIAGAK